MTLSRKPKEHPPDPVCEECGGETDAEHMRTLWCSCLRFPCRDPHCIGAGYIECEVCAND